MHSGTLLPLWDSDLYHVVTEQVKKKKRVLPPRVRLSGVAEEEWITSNAPRVEPCIYLFISLAAEHVHVVALGEMTSLEKAYRLLSFNIHPLFPPPPHLIHFNAAAMLLQGRT